MQNPEKTDNGELVTAYECDPMTADQEFLLAKRQYEHATGRRQKRDVIAYQIRQSFRPGEVTPEEANAIGQELAKRFTKGKHAFIVATHTDRSHIHNHIVFNSTSLDCTRKFRDFHLSWLVLSKLSDMICLEHKLSVITPKPYRERTKYKYPERLSIRDQIRADIDAAMRHKPQSFQELVGLLEQAGYAYQEGKHPAIRGKNQKKFVRFKSLGDGYTPEDLGLVFAGEREHQPRKPGKQTEQPARKMNLLIDIQQKMVAGQGVISDRCEINRQIKADNALLHELKAAVRKLAQAVKNTIPALAEAMERLRGNMIIFRYQLRHIGMGKHRMNEHIQAAIPKLERYMSLVRQFKEKTKERKNLLAEKKETPFYQIPKLRDLARSIAELTEELEELQTEKEMLLRSLDCADDTGISAVKKEIATLEGALQKLSEQEAKYSAELDEALKQYVELKEQAAGMDAGELMDARLVVRDEKERSAVDKVKAAYGEKYDPMMMHDSKRDVASLLHENAEIRSIRERLRQKQQQQAQQKQTKKKSRDSWER